MIPMQAWPVTNKTQDEKDVITIDDHDTKICVTRDLQDMEKNNARKWDDPDASLARFLQKEEYQVYSQNKYRSKEKKEEKKAMKTTHTGRAWEFVRTVIDRHQKLASSPKGRGDNISNVAVDDMVFQAERLLDFQAEFELLNAPTKVTLAYHYTRDYNMERIKTEGLMTRADQNRMLMGLTYGDGVYVSTNPFAFHGKYGNVGILVAVLMGNAQRIMDRSSFHNTARFNEKVNTIIGNKKCASGSPETQLYDEIVLQNSSQCLPLVRFSDILVSTTDDNSPNNDSVWAYHREMQRIVDDCFNNGTKTEIVRTFPSEIQAVNVNLQSNSHLSYLRPFPSHPVVPPILRNSGKFLPQPSVLPGKFLPPPSVLPGKLLPPPSVHPGKLLPLPSVPQYTVQSIVGQVLPTLNTPFSPVQEPIETNSIRYLAPETLVNLKSNLFDTVDIISTSEDCPVCIEKLCGTQRIVSLKI